MKTVKRSMVATGLREDRWSMGIFREVKLLWCNGTYISLYICQNT